MEIARKDASFDKNANMQKNYEENHPRALKLTKKGKESTRFKIESVGSNEFLKMHKSASN